MPATDLRALGRLAGQHEIARRRSRRRFVVRPVAGVPATTRRPRLPRPLLVLLAVVVAVVAYLGAVAVGETAEEAPPAPAAPGLEEPAAVAGEREATARRPSGERADRGGRPVAPAAFASVGDLALELPHPDSLGIAFHEASRAEALELSPSGRLEANDNAGRYQAPPDADGPAYRILPSRGRARPATSAVDVVVPAGAAALAPVSGRVVETRQYALYGHVRDWRVVIEPEHHPELHVVLIHLHQPSVAPGDRVRAGETALGVVRQLPFTSHVDRYVDVRAPHVHLEVKPATATTPHDPNEPARSAADRLQEVSGGRFGDS